MKFEARLPRDDVNVTPTHPLRETLLLLLGLVLVGGELLDQIQESPRTLPH
jgi:hypothetical protein